jgi:hypothetical protein
MREALMLQLERLCYYQHLSLSGGRNRPIFACRIIDIRGTRFHVLSRLHDAGLDFTGRTNFIAHHLVFTPEEIRQNASPPVILRSWPGWVQSWSKEPELLQQEDWTALATLSGQTNIPAHTWQRLTGDAVNGYGLLESRAGASFRVDAETEETVLDLMAESLELLEVRDARKDYRGTAWQYTFTTSMQEQDNPADFRWRCVHSDNPAATRFVTPDCRSLSELRPVKATFEEAAFARSGRQAPRMVVQPHDLRITEGEIARFSATAEGVPSPSYQWMSVDRANNGEAIQGQNKAELVVPSPPIGISRYLLQVSNSAGTAQTRVITLAVERALRISQAPGDFSSRIGGRSTEELGVSPNNRAREQRLGQAELAERIFRRRQRHRRIFFGIFSVAAIAALCAGLIMYRRARATRSGVTGHGASGEGSGHPAASTNVQAPVRSPESATLKQEAFLESKLPPGWEVKPIGSVTNLNIQFDLPRVEVSGAAQGFSEGGDDVMFVCRSLGTNFSQQASVLHLEGTSPTNISGIMVRTSQERLSGFLFIGASATQICVYGRSAKNEFFSIPHPVPPPFQERPKIFRLLTTRTNVLALYSYDAATWNQGADSIDIGPPSLMGLALCSGDPTVGALTRFGGLLPPGKVDQQDAFKRP